MHSSQAPISSANLSRTGIGHALLWAFLSPAATAAACGGASPRRGAGTRTGHARSRRRRSRTRTGPAARGNRAKTAAAPAPPERQQASLRAPRATPRVRSAGTLRSAASPHAAANAARPPRRIPARRVPRRGLAGRSRAIRARRAGRPPALAPVGLSEDVQKTKPRSSNSSRTTARAVGPVVARTIGTFSSRHQAENTRNGSSPTSLRYPRTAPPDPHDGYRRRPRADARDRPIGFGSGSGGGGI